jgi:outer membrane protein OmpA-like peptidoglycan-associated protein
MKKGPPPEEKGEQAPLWIISFADMISLLMAFFVMLLTMSHTGRTGKICDEGSGEFERTLGGFRESISAYGMPGWLGSEKDNVEFTAPKTYYNAGGEKTKTNTRIIDLHEDRIRDIYKKLSGKSKTLKSQIQGSKPEFTALPITFEQDQTALNADSVQILNKYIEELYGAADSIKTIYVVGIASDESSESKQWTVSTLRAQAVAEYLKSKVPSRFAVYSWGAGSGGAWVSRDGMVSKSSQISIAVLKSND